MNLWEERAGFDLYMVSEIKRLNSPYICSEAKEYIKGENGCAMIQEDKIKQM